MSKIDLRQGDCLELMKNIPDKYFDLCITDFEIKQPKLFDAI